MQDEIKHLKFEERPKIIEAIAEAREHGDLSENAEYHAAREKQSFVEGRILELEDKLARAEIIDISKLSGDIIKFGATVNLYNESTKKEVKYIIVSEYEANIEKSMISISSPIAKALIGKVIGDYVEVSTPKGRVTYEILEVHYNEYDV